jgi:hypothetical protein
MSEYTKADTCGWSTPLQLGVWTQVTLVKKHRYCWIYLDELKTARFKPGGNMITNDGDLYIGGYHHFTNVRDSGFDNI